MQSTDMMARKRKIKAVPITIKRPWQGLVDFSNITESGKIRKGQHGSGNELINDKGYHQ
jgi:hypothetical protein